MKDLLVVGDIPGFADSLLRGWEAKKRLASRISNPTIERAYQVRSRTEWSPARSPVPVVVAFS
jgi:galactokinase/mevalonate kinase-like predicted kinase